MRCMVMGKRERQGQLTVPILTIPKMVTKLISKYLASTIFLKRIAPRWLHVPPEKKKLCDTITRVR